MDFDAKQSNEKAGLYLTNGNQEVIVRLYTGLVDGEKKVVFQYNNQKHVIANSFGNVLCLKIVRDGHRLSGFCSADGVNWIVTGAPLDVKDLDKEQPNYNSWVGTSIGLFSEGKSADFDSFIYKDAFTPLAAIGYSNYYAAAKVQKAGRSGVVNTSEHGGWFMISGVDFGKDIAERVDVVVKSKVKTSLEIRIDDLSDGKLVAKINIDKLSGDKIRHYLQRVNSVSGQHDVYVKFSPSANGQVWLQSLTFIRR